jgi:hypothetical protein
MESLVEHGWTGREDGKYVHADHAGHTIEIIERRGWLSLMHRDGRDRLLGHSRYHASPAEYLVRFHAQRNAKSKTWQTP